MARSLLVAFVFCVLVSFVLAQDTCSPTDPVCSVSRASGQISATEKPGLFTRLFSGLFSRVKNRAVSWLKRVIVPGANGVPLGYFTDMFELTKPGFTWLAGFCGTPTTIGCGKTNTFPGPQVEGFTGYQRVKEAIAAMPRKEWSGEWWRGNELGTLINNPLFYSLGDKGDNQTWISPQAIALGISPKQHAVIRPIFEAALIKRGENRAKYLEYIETTADKLIATAKAKGRLTHFDLLVWFQKVVNYFNFDIEVSDEYAIDFVKLQGEMLSGQLRSQLIPKLLYGRDPMNLNPVLERVRKHVLIIKEYVQDKYGDMLEGQDCSPSKSCLMQASYAILDANMAAGGVSVPGTLMQALAVVYSTDPSNPAGKALEDYTPEEALQLHWEAIRIFPPVVVFPYWSPRPTCVGLTAKQTADLAAPNGQTKPCPLGMASKRTGFPPVNQYKGGTRHLPNVALAQIDEEVWGPNAAKFKLRPLHMYDKYSQGFCEAAEDPNVADGRMNRSCPGRSMALLMGKAFLSRFRPKEWVVNPDHKIVIKTGGPYVDTEKLIFHLKETVEKCVADKCGCKQLDTACKCAECYE